MNRGPWADGCLMRFCCRGAAIGVGVLACLVAGAPSWADPGEPDPGFGQGGLAVLSVGATGGRLDGAGILPDGRIVAVGSAEDEDDVRASLVMRYRTDGTLDPSFGDAGVVRTATHPESTFAKAIVTLPNGEVVVGGDHGNFVGMYLARYEVDGELDAAFGDEGIVVRENGVKLNELNALAVQSDRFLVAAGEIFPGFGLVRFGPDGDIDTTFGEQGAASTEIGERSDVSAVAILPDGRILAAGTYRDGEEGGVALALYKADGGLDATFGDGGVLQIRPAGRDARVEGMVIQPDGRIILAGAIERAPDGVNRLVMRLLSNGSFDPSFGTDGVLEDVDDFSRAVSAVALQPDGKIVVSSFRTCLRFDSDGGRDESFSDDGLAPVDVDTEQILIRPDGSILLAGTHRKDDEFETGLAVFDSGLDLAIPQGALESPAEGSDQGDLGAVLGWTCAAGNAVIVVDDVWFLVAPGGLDRPETAEACGDSNNGFALTIPWTLFGSGEHEAVLFADGREISRNLFNVFSIVDLLPEIDEVGEGVPVKLVPQLMGELHQALVAISE